MHQGEHFLTTSSNFIQLCKLLIETIQCIFARFWTGHGWVATQGMVLVEFSMNSKFWTKVSSKLQIDNNLTSSLTRLYSKTSW